MIHHAGDFMCDLDVPSTCGKRANVLVRTQRGILMSQLSKRLTVPEAAQAFYSRWVGYITTIVLPPIGANQIL